ncbi:MAG: hypothetical protein BWK79_01460 [Beggiatoa sp. IS2]|nr:MAG: hypothetical protein BWK79_01460 [Beggiatoa sp. IS2]
MTMEQRLLQSFGQLSPSEQETLVAFAEFLQERTTKTPDVLSAPQLTPRPPKESVVAAIKRLSKGYPMLDKSKMLDETSALMTEHIMRGRAAVEVINELEKVFAHRYEDFKTQFSKK